MLSRSCFYSIAALSLLTLALVACGQKPAEQPANTNPDQSANPSNTSAPNTPAATPAPGAPAAKAPAAKNANKPATATPTVQALTIPEGTMITVRLGQALSSKTSQDGEPFTATIAEPIQVNGNVMIPQGAEAAGTVQEAAPLGRFKGGARLKIALDSVTVNGKKVPLQTAVHSYALKGKGKRTAGIIGGGAGLGAIIGGITGGGKGAAIGAAAGAGAGTAGAAFTGNKDIVLPAESAVSFKLLKPAQIK